MWGGGGRRNSPNTRLVPQPSDSHLWRLSLSGDSLPTKCDGMWENLKSGFRKLTDWRASTFLFLVVCDRAHEGCNMGPDAACPLAVRFSAEHSPCSWHTRERGALWSIWRLSPWDVKGTSPVASRSSLTSQRSHASAPPPGQSAGGQGGTRAARPPSRSAWPHRRPSHLRCR